MIDHAYLVELHHVSGESISPGHEPDVIIETLDGIGASLQQFSRGEGQTGRLDFSTLVTTATRDFLAGVDDPRNVSVVVKEYDNFNPAYKVQRFVGRLLEMPRRGRNANEDVYTFQTTGLLAIYDEVDVLDPVSNGAYRDEYFADLIPEILADAGHVGGYDLTTQPLESDEPFTSRLFYPGKHKFGGAYNTTDLIEAMCSDGTHIYIGVGHWLCRYNPVTRDRVRLARLHYTGNEVNLQDDQFRICSLAYDAGTVYGWADSTYASLSYPAAHVKVRFTWAAGPVINLTDANLIYNYDRGYYIKSTFRQMSNYLGPSGTDQCDWFYEDIGEAMPVSSQTLGIPEPMNRSNANITGAVVPGQNVFYVALVPPDQILLNDIFWLLDTTNFRRQNLGKVVQIIERTSNYWKIKTTDSSRYQIASGNAACYWWHENQYGTRSNVVMPGYRDVKVFYDQADAEGSPTPIDVRVERRTAATGRDEFYWPQTLGTASEDRTLPVFTEYIALGECNTPENYISGATNYYMTENVPKFNLHMEDVCRFANLPVQGYWVENGRRDDETKQVGPNKLMFNGVQVRFAGDNSPVQTHCNIFLCLDNGVAYCAFNRWKQPDYVGYPAFFQLVWGQLNGAIFTQIGTDRQSNNFTSRPPREITGFGHRNGRYWFGVKRVEPLWKNTDIQVVWAAPPQAGDKPTNYEGGLIVVCMTTYDKTEYLQTGTLFRIGMPGLPRPKEYLISECEAIAPRNFDTTHAWVAQGYEGRTYFVAYALDPFMPLYTYSRAAKEEILGPEYQWPFGGYMCIMDGYDVRGEICYGQNYNLIVSHTATESYYEGNEGEAYDYAQEEWHGEEVTPSISRGRMAEADVSQERVVAGSIIVTLKNGKKRFTLTDYTDLLVRGEMQIPPPGEVYILRRGHIAHGGSFTDCILYFNPIYAGMAFDVEYEYYAERYYVAPFVRDNVLYFNEVGPEAQRWIIPTVRTMASPPGVLYWYDPNAILPDPAWKRKLAWPAAPVAVANHGEDVYALAAMDGALMKFGQEWPGYINVDVGGDDPVDVFQILTEIAKTADLYLGEENGRVKFRHRGPSASVPYNPDHEDFEVAELAEVPAYRAVLITYADGKALYPLTATDTPDRLILALSMPYVMTYGHALLLAKEYYDYYRGGATIYDVETLRDGLNLPVLGEHIEVGDIQGRLLGYATTGSKISLSIEKTGDRLEIGAPICL